MVVFRLNGTGSLPPDPEPAPAPMPSNETFPAGMAAAGQGKFNAYCSRCHGGNGASPNVVPDLRRSAITNDKAAWHAVVMEGALTDAGMIAWKPYISEQDSEAMRAFIHEEAVKLVRRGGVQAQAGGQAEGAAPGQ
jgi:mono/diheme cytochrome c family protein